MGKERKVVTIAELLNSLPTHTNPSIKCMAKWARNCRTARVHYADEKASQLPEQLIKLLDDSIMSVSKVTCDDKTPFEEAIIRIRDYVTTAALAHMTGK